MIGKGKRICDGRGGVEYEVGKEIKGEGGGREIEGDEVLGWRGEEMVEEMKG